MTPTEQTWTSAEDNVPEVWESVDAELDDGSERIVFRSTRGDWLLSVDDEHYDAEQGAKHVIRWRPRPARIDRIIFTKSL